MAKKAGRQALDYNFHLAKVCQQTKTESQTHARPKMQKESQQHQQLEKKQRARRKNTEIVVEPLLMEHICVEKGFPAMSPCVCVLA